MQSLLTTREAAEILRVHTVTLSQWAKHGRIPATKVGGAWRFSKAALQAWLDDPARSPSQTVHHE